LLLPGVLACSNDDEKTASEEPAAEEKAGSEDSKGDDYLWDQE